MKRPPLHYPVELVRAVALVWLLAGLRASEIRRLRIGCVRRQQTGATDSTAEVCLLDVPVNTTSPAFTKPVPAALAETVEAWERVWPEQPLMLDARTSVARLAHLDGLPLLS